MTQFFSYLYHFFCYLYKAAIVFKAYELISFHFNSLSDNFENAGSTRTGGHRFVVQILRSREILIGTKKFVANDTKTKIESAMSEKKTFSCKTVRCGAGSCFAFECWYQTSFRSQSFHMQTTRETF